MKVFQIENGICYWDATQQFPTKQSTVGYFPPSVEFVETPDYVMEGWEYKNGQPIKPAELEGWSYNESTGQWYDPNAQYIEPEPELETGDATWAEMAQAIKEGVNTI